MFTLITDRRLREKLTSGEYIHRLNILFSFGVCRVIVRDEHDEISQKKTLDELENITAKAIDTDNTNKSTLYTLSLNSDYEKFNRLKAEYKLTGIHMRSSDFLSTSINDIDEFKNQGFIVGTSIHSSLEYDLANAQSPNYMLLSPIFLTSCKPNAKKIDYRELDHIISKASEDNMEIIALGGIGNADVFNLENKLRYKKFSNYAIRSLFYESKNLKIDLEKILEVARHFD